MTGCSRRSIYKCVQFIPAWMQSSALTTEGVPSKWGSVQRQKGVVQGGKWGVWDQANTVIYGKTQTIHSLSSSSPDALAVSQGNDQWLQFKWIQRLGRSRTQTYTNYDISVEKAHPFKGLALYAIRKYVTAARLRKHQLKQLKLVSN